MAISSLTSSLSATAGASNTSLASPGIGSGLDVNGLVSKLMAVEQLPLTQVNNTESSYQSQLSAYGTMKGYLAAFQTAAKALETPTSFAVSKANVSNAGVLSAASGTSAVQGTYNVTVGQLAQAQKLASSGYADTTSAVANGPLPATLTLNFADSSKAPVNIPIGSSQNSLGGIRDAINSANAGVTASIVNDGSTNGNRLVISANATGANDGVNLSSSDAGLAALAAGMTQVVVPQDAKLSVDGIGVDKASNTVTDAIQGITLNLAALGSSQVNVVQDTSTITSNIQGFVTAYNNLASFIKTDTAYDASTQTGSVLSGDSTTRLIQQAIRNVFNTPVLGAPSGQSLLTDIGLSFQADGTLSLDSTKLSSALADPNLNIANIFAKTATSTGYGSQIDTLVGNMLDTTGALTTRTDGLNSTIKDLETQKTALNDRLAQTQQTYLAEFNALDTTIASLNSESTFLTQSGL